MTAPAAPVAEIRDHAIAHNRAAKAQAIAVVWKAAGGDAELLEQTVAAAELSGPSGRTPERTRARARLQLTLGCASQYRGRTQATMWDNASDDTWRQAVAFLRTQL
jgi:hypothetical protein